MNTKNLSPLVSVLLNCFNAEKTISKSLESVLKQTYTNFEIVIWDDGSNDRTFDILKSYKDKRIRLFKNDVNIGLGKSRLKATKVLKGSLISIIDSDDFFHPEKIEKQVKVFKTNPNISICATWSKILDENYEKLYFFDSQNESRLLKKKLKFVNVIPHSSTMYKKQLAIDVGWYSKEFEYSQDYDLTLKLMDKGEIFLIKDYLTTIISGKNNMSNSNKLRELVVKESITILRENISKSDHSLEEKKIFKYLEDLYQIKLNLINIKKNFLKNFLNISSILLSNPFIVFKINLIKSLKEI